MHRRVKTFKNANLHVRVQIHTGANFHRRLKNCTFANLYAESGNLQRVQIHTSECKFSKMQICTHEWKFAQPSENLQGRVKIFIPSRTAMYRGSRSSPPRGGARCHMTRAQPQPHQWPRVLLQGRPTHMRPHHQHLCTSPGSRFQAFCVAPSACPRAQRRRGHAPPAACRGRTAETTPVYTTACLGRIGRFSETYHHLGALGRWTTPTPAALSHHASHLCPLT